MKANEAPKRVYIHKSQYWGLMANEHNITKNGVEYVRTDAFIEKAKEFIWSHTEGSDYHVNYVLKEFENFMKGE